MSDNKNSTRYRQSIFHSASGPDYAGKLCGCLLCLLFLASCVKDELHRTPHPDCGVVSVSVNHPQGAEDNYTVEVDGQPLDEDDNASEPLTPGEHKTLAYNTPEGFTIADGVASVNATGDGLIASLPGRLYSGVKTVTVVADDTLNVRIDVNKQTRDLRLELTVTEGDPERIATITGTLSGVAGAYDLRNETLYGEAVSTTPAFTRSGDKIEADLRLLGTKGEAQTLTLTLTFTDGLTQTVESDLTEVLANFNGDMEQTFTVTGALRTPTEAGLGGCTITDWTHGGGGSGSAT